MAAPVLANRSVCFVNKVGTDDAGYNGVGYPNSKLTIAAALADLAANYPAASAINPHIVAVGPGFFAVAAAIALPPWTYIVGSCDGQGQPNTTLSLADSNADIILATGWTANSTARGGLGNLIIRAASGTPIIDFTIPVPVAGNPSRTIEVFNLKHDLPQCIFEATSTADVWDTQTMIQDGLATDVITQTGGTSRFNNIVAAALTTIIDKDLFAAAGVWQGVVITNASSRVQATSIAAAGCTLRLTNSSPRALQLSETAPGVIAVQADATSIPLTAAVTYTGTAVSTDLTRLSDANGEGYTPTTPGNWPVVPLTVQQGLDYLAASGSLVAANSYATDTNNAGNSTVTPTAHNYFLGLTVTGAARTSVLILSTATPPAAGDRIAIGCTLPATGAIVLQFRNSVVGGTLVYNFTTDGVTLSGLFEFVYTGAAWTFAGYQIPYQT